MLLISSIIKPSANHHPLVFHFAKKTSTSENTSTYDKQTISIQFTPVPNTTSWTLSLEERLKVRKHFLNKEQNLRQALKETDLSNGVVCRFINLIFSDKLNFNSFRKESCETILKGLFNCGVEALNTGFIETSTDKLKEFNKLNLQFNLSGFPGLYDLKKEDLEEIFSRFNEDYDKLKNFLRQSKSY